jgi:hypothetical protein
MRSYLVVANQTRASPTLAAAVGERLVRGRGKLLFRRSGDTRSAWPYLGMRPRPKPPLKSGLTRSSAAARDALRAHAVDEILLSTLPAGMSRWPALDVPASLKRAVDIPVTVLTAPREPAATAPG